MPAIWAQFRSFQVLSSGICPDSPAPNGSVVQSEPWFGRLLLQHEEPAGVGDRLVAGQVEADERDVGIERASEQRMPLGRRPRLGREVSGQDAPAVVQDRLHRVDQRAWIAAQQLAADEQHEPVAAVSSRSLPSAPAPHRWIGGMSGCASVPAGAGSQNC